MDSSLKHINEPYFTSLEEYAGLEMAQDFYKKNMLKETVEVYKRILDLNPQSTPALLNMGATLHEMGLDEEAIECFDKVILDNPKHGYAHYFRSLLKLSEGELEEGFTENLYRYGRYGVAKTLHKEWNIEWWDGEDLQGKRILVWTEQGIGDEILLCSMLPDLVAMGASLVICCTSRLVPLLKRTYPNAEFIVRKRDKPELEPDQPKVVADYQAGVSELGVFLRPNMEAFKNTKPFLDHNNKVSMQLRDKYLKGSTDYLVGISWASFGYCQDEKSTSIFDWLRILQIPGIKFVSLQYDVPPNLMKIVNKLPNVHIIKDSSVDPIKDMDRFAAQVAAMDCVISVSNTTVHVAGAMGVPVWNIVPEAKGCHWYWFKNRADSPWYPTMKILRRSGSIYHTMANIEDTLKQLPPNVAV